MNQKKRGIKISARIIVTALIILSELAFISYIAFKLSVASLIVYICAELSGVFTSIHIITVRGNQDYKVMWIIFILVFPVLGVLSYLLWGGGRVFPHYKKRMERCTDKYLSSLPDDFLADSRLLYEDMIHSRQAEFLRNYGDFRIYDNTSSEFFAPCENLMPQLLDDLKNAEKFIFIEFFILAEGKMWDAIHNILKQKAENGVDVKIIFDDFGSANRQNKNFVHNLINEGIGVSVFNPIKPSIDLFMNNRNHRKIIVIDGKTAYTGGFNIADEYINQFERFGYWMDCAIRITGNAVKSFTAMFAAMWEFNSRDEINMDFHTAESEQIDDGLYIPYCDSPLDGNKASAEGIYLQILNTARKYVYITTPYLILSNSFISALIMAAKSGIDIRIITPHIPDKKYVHLVTQSYYNDLLEAGVRIFEYTPGFIHSKLFVSDDSVATVGTVNVDFRSFYLHFECGVWVCKSKSVKDIKEKFEDIQKDSTEINLKEWKKRSMLSKFSQRLLRLFAPYM